jgi:hypothetical protein
MENLAKAIVDGVYLFGQLMDKWANDQANIATTTQIPVSDTITSIFSNLISFLSQLSSEIMSLI